MSSDVGEIMDAIITAAEGAVSGLTGYRGLKLVSDLTEDEDFPYLCVYDPDESTELGDFLMTRSSVEVAMLLYTKEETQEAVAVKMDAIRDAIDTDATLGGVVQFAHVSTRSIREDPAEDVKAGYMLVETVEATGRLFHAVIECEVIIAPVYTNWTSVIGTISYMLQNHFDAPTGNSVWRTDRDTIPSGQSRFQLRAVLLEWDPITSNNYGMRLSIELHVWYHIPAGAAEPITINTTIFNQMDGALDAKNWRALATVYDVPTPPHVTSAEVAEEA